ncbi:MAG: flavodoxin family protein [Candidatus Methanoplasma sp.]|jgi:multimeric flavodoxin WrbA|nr:flavodoxin family protein [Candidatus Methanoplasma sp.]
MKVVALNGSPRLLGNTSNVLNDMLDEIGKDGIETEQIQLYDFDFGQCNDCRSCEMRGDGRCIIEDGLNEVVDKLREADGIILASPAYFGGCSSQMKIFLERAGLSLDKGDRGLRRKAGAAVSVVAHDGGDATYNELAGWLLRMGILVVGSNPLPVLRALNSPRYLEDKEGMKGVVSQAKDVAWAVLLMNGLA